MTSAFQIFDRDEQNEVLAMEHEVVLAVQEIKKQYLEDNIPWIIGFSGGKDSTALLQMVFYALSELTPAQLTKEVHVLSNDTLVENPKVVQFIDQQLERILTAGMGRLFAHKPELFQVYKTTPKLEDTFWLNIIGKGYPSPNRWFRWCTERMKINPTSDYILSTVSKHGKAIILLGTRKDESTNRSASMKRYEIAGTRLRKHSLPNAYVFAPISELSNKQVWGYLTSSSSPWGTDNYDLVSLYYKAYDLTDADCPLVIDATTPSCGSSRFGCWVCTVVDKDKSMAGMIASGESWMQPLMDFRDWLYEIRNDETKRMNRRRSGQEGLGPFIMEVRKEILERLLHIENKVGYDFISLPELSAIQLQWRYDGNFDYEVAEIYERIKGKKIMPDDNDLSQRRKEEYELLDEVCQEVGVDSSHIKELMELEREHLSFLRRHNVIDDIATKVKNFVTTTEEI